MILALDIGSSSVKAAHLRGVRVVGDISIVPYKTSFDGPRVEVDPAEILRAVHQAVRSLARKPLDAIALSVMAPAWIAMDKLGKPLTPIVTHQDRRSVAEAIEIEKRVGKQRHLSIAGVRPVPGGISSTTWAWFLKHHPSLMKRADLVGHLNTFLIRTFTGQRIVDPSNASFMGVYSTITMRGWNRELCQAVHLPERLLPRITESNQIAGELVRETASGMGVAQGTPVFAGMIDTSAAMLLTGAKIGQLLNTCGSTDVLALLTDRPKPNERLITRAFGIGERWMSVSTIAAAGSAILWARQQLFSDYSWEKFNRLVLSLASSQRSSAVQFDPYLAGDRMSIEQRTASFSGLTLSTTRQQMLRAIINALAHASAERLPLLAAGGTKLLRRVITSGRGFDSVLRRDWTGRWQFKRESEASLRGLGKLLEQ